jgi:GNAT superfamily N-acetyltransferase
MLSVVPYQVEFQTECQTLLRDIFGDDLQTVGHYRLSATSGTYVARLKGRAVGLGVAWNNKMHPSATRCAVAVHPIYRQQGIGGKLFDAIRKYTSQMPLTTSVWETQFQGMRFALKHGFREFRRTYTVSLSISDLNLSPYRELVDDTEQNGYRIVPMSLITDSEQRRCIASLCKSMYAETHQDNPPIELTEAEWMEMTFADDLIQQGSFAVIHDNEIKAVSLLHEGSDRGTMEFGWRGISESHPLREQDLVRMMAFTQIEFAVSHGAEVMLLECDSTDRLSQYVLELLPFAPSPTWITLKTV